MIAENPVEAQVKSSTEQQGVEEDTEDEDLLGYSDEVIIHPAGSQSVQVVQGRGGLQTAELTGPLTITMLPLLSSGFPLVPALVSVLSCILSTTLLDLSSRTTITPSFIIYSSLQCVSTITFYSFRYHIGYNKAINY